MLLPLSVKLENVEPILNINLAIKLNLVCNLVLLFNQVQLFLDGRALLELVFSDLEKNFNHVLGSLIDVRLVEDVAELIEHGQRDGRLHLLQVLPHLLAESHSNLNTVVGRLVQEQQENLASQHLMLNLLVDQMREERRRGEADGLVVSLESLAELHNQAFYQQLADLGKLRVDNRRHGRVDGREG